MSHIEQRLVEMEILALELMSACDGASVSTEAFRLSTNQRQVLVDFAQKQSKSDKIEEWRSLPVGNLQQRQSWWLAKQKCLLESGVAQPRQVLDHVANVDIALERAGGLQSVDRLSSLAQGLPQPPLFATSPSTSMREGPVTNSSASVCHDAGSRAVARVSRQDRGAGTPSMPMDPVVEMSPPMNDYVAEDRWRKYF